MLTLEEDSSGNPNPPSRPVTLDDDDYHNDEDDDDGEDEDDPVETLIPLHTLSIIILFPPKTQHNCSKLWPRPI